MILLFEEDAPAALPVVVLSFTSLIFVDGIVGFILSLLLPTPLA
jgi:hypothetical protein